MLIPCPHCGPRDLAEFTYGGDASKVRPAADAPQQEWCDHLYARENPMGAHREYWQHVHGCRAWLIVRRDTLTHTIAGAEIAGPWGAGVAVRAPALDPAE